VFKTKAKQHTKGIDSIVDVFILRDFGKKNVEMDSVVIKRCEDLSALSASVKSKKLKHTVIQYIHFTKSIALLHFDPRINYEALGNVLHVYTEKRADLYEALRRPK